MKRAPFYVLSAFRPENTQEQNVRAHYEMHVALDSMKRCGWLEFRPSLGRYNGEFELSYVVTPLLGATDHANPSHELCTLAARFNQDSLLMVEDRQTAYLISAKRRNNLCLGKWTAFDYANMAHAPMSYTQVNREYFTCR